MKKTFYGLLLFIVSQSCSKTSSNSNNGGGPASISSLSYVDGIIGDTVKIAGVNFSPTSSNNTVEFNAVKAFVVSSTSSAIIAVVPPGATTGNVTVTVNGQPAGNPQLFTVVAVNVFTTGYDINYAGVVFRNGALIQNITVPGAKVVLTSVYVSGSDVYVCGNIQNTSTGKFTVAYWKNGSEVDLAKGSAFVTLATSICVSGNDVYVSGNDSTLLLKYWKNGNSVNLLNQNFPYATTSAIYVSGSNVYVTGFYYTSFILPSVGDYWKNGIEVKLNTTNTGTGISNILPIYVSGNDVYVAGTQLTYNATHDTTKDQAVYWKNGVKVDLGQVDDGSSTSGIYVSGNDVYVSGNGDEDSSFYWKNGNITTLTPAQNAIAAITGDGPNIYFLGIAVESNVGIWGYWINGTFVNIPSNIALNNLLGIYLQKTP